MPSASYWGAITLGDCSYPGTGESGFIAVHPQDPDIVYCGAVGSSPGGAGALQRYDYRTGQIQLVNVWPEESTGIAPRDMKYRFAWTFPIVFSPHDSNVLYAGGNHVFRTRNEGMSWEEISPDLSLNDVSRQGASGGEITRESAGAEVHATCACVVESPHRKGEIWASTDDGLVHVTRDDGASWQNVTPPRSAGACLCRMRRDFGARSRHRLCSGDPLQAFGLQAVPVPHHRWRPVLAVHRAAAFPASEITRVVRADPVRQGLLFVGTETGIYVTLDDGQAWTRMAGGLPVVPVYDLKIKDGDLVAGTHGRSFWILDDISPLRALADGSAGTRLIRAARDDPHQAAFRCAWWRARPVFLRASPSASAAASRPSNVPMAPECGSISTSARTRRTARSSTTGSPTSTSEPVAITFRDAAGRGIVTLRSDDDHTAGGAPPSARAAGSTALCGT